MRMFPLFSGILSFTLLLAACVEYNPIPPEPEPEPEENKANTWIYRVMDEDYLWYQDMPDKSSLDFTLEPEAFFNSLLSDKDGVIYNGSHLYFSAIEKKSTETKAISENESTYGFEFIAFSVSRTSEIWYAQVLYVLSGSPADKAGLKRGDWITGIGANAETINSKNYQKLETGGAVRFDIMELKNNAFVSKGSVQLEAAVTMDVSPFIKDTVLYAGGKTIGYLAYTHFASGPDNSADKSYDNRMKEIFGRFKSKQVDEFVLDLRYNSGGIVSSAILLSSLLAPSPALGDVFGYFEYNGKQKPNEVTLRFDNDQSVRSANLNLSRLYVLTGQWTASASEAVINTLIPYTGRENIQLIGTKTIGKPVGSSTYGEKEDYGYLLHPIVLRIYNKDRTADYENGFLPDISMNEYDSDNSLAPLGSPDELLLAEALRQMGAGTLRSVPATTLLSFGRPVYSSLDRRDGGLILDSNLNP